MDASSPAARATPSAGEGYFIQPTVIADIPAKSTLEQEEIFGPVLVVIKSRNFDHALEIANDTEFGLTGAVYSSSREKLDRAVREFHVGNLYLNRKCTGAMVGAHPFGGFNMSGTDSKSGGPDYLLSVHASKERRRENRVETGVAPFHSAAGGAASRVSPRMQSPSRLQHSRRELGLRFRIQFLRVLFRLRNLAGRKL